MQQEIAAGTLTVRQVTPAERERHPRRQYGGFSTSSAPRRRSSLRRVDADSINRAFERIRDFEAVQSQAVFGLAEEERVNALGHAVHNLREAVAITDEASAAFHDQISRLFEDATGRKLPKDTGEWTFLGFILGLIAIEMEQDARGD